MGDGRITLGDVARVASVSVATVSRALRDDPQIGEATRKRIRTVAEELGYVPNVAARSLVLQLTSTFGLMVPDVTDPIHGQVVTAFQQHATEHAYTVIVANGFGDPEAERRALRTFTSHRVDGVAVMGSVLRQEEVVRIAAPSRVVFIGSENLTITGFDTELPRGCIRSDDRDGMRQIVSHVLSQGYRSIAYVGGPPSASQVIRREALLAELETHGADAPLLVTVPGYDTGDISGVARTLSDERPDVAVCYDDKTALNLMDELRVAGLSVPDDIGVIGFDDIPFARIANPRLTTVAQPSEELGRSAVEYLVDGLAAGELMESRQFPVKLIVRESSPGPNQT